MRFPILGVGWVLLLALAANAQTVDIVALRGDKSPGLDDTFTSFDFTNGALDEFGNVAFLAGLATQGQFGPLSGFFLFRDGDSLLIARDFAEGRRVLDRASLRFGGRYAFTAQSNVTGTGPIPTGAWVENGDAPVRPYSNVPGVPGASFFRVGEQAGGQRQFAAAGNHVAFFAKIEDPGNPDLNSSNDTGIWAGPAGNLGLAARRGSQMPGGPGGVKHNSFGDVVVNRSGTTIFFANGNNDAFTEFFRGVYRSDGGGGSLVEAGVFTDLTINTGGTAAYRNQDAITINGSSKRVVDLSGSLSVAGFVLLDNDSLVVVGDDGGTTKILRETPGGMIELAKEGDPAEGLGGSFTFANIDMVSANNNGQVAFRAFYTGPFAGWWVADRSGNLQLKVDRGQAFSARGRSWMLEDHVGFDPNPFQPGVKVDRTGADGYPTYFNDNGDLLLNAGLTDQETSEFLNALILIPGASTVINSTADRPDAAAGDGMCDTGSTINRGSATEPECTLRAAIEETNAAAGVQTARFNIPSQDAGFSANLNAWVIRPTGSLPPVTDPLTIAGETQSAGKSSAAVAARPTIVLSGAGGATNGLTIRSAATVSGLSVVAFSGSGIEVAEGPATIHSNYIGVDPAGSASGNGRGIEIGDATGRRSTVSSNLVSGNTTGILASGSNHVILSNYIGTDTEGTTGIPNQTGIHITGSNIEVGGTDRESANLVSGNGAAGILVAGSDNAVQNNLVGTTLVETGALPNDFGIDVAGATSTAILDNVVAGNDSSGVRIRDSAVGTDVFGNGIGMILAGIVPLGNARFGVEIVGATGSRIGGVSGRNSNTIGGNRKSGVIIRGGRDNSIAGNLVGVAANLVTLAPNEEHGIEVVLADTNTIGGLVAQERNTVSGNKRGGIRISASRRVGVMGNFIGLDPTGLNQIPNGGAGITITDSDTVTVGGVGPGRQNSIAGNDSSGVLIERGSDGTIVFGNRIGLSVTGTALGNLIGIKIDAGINSAIGDTTIGAGNTIIGNDSTGVLVVDAASFGNAIVGNELRDNGALEIDLGADGHTANDLGNGAAMDGDAGPNRLMNFPLAIFASPDSADPANKYRLTGILDTPRPQKAVIHIYQSDATDGDERGAARNRFGQGEELLATVVPSPQGRIRFEIDKANVTKPFLSATATDSAGSTSEFSAVCYDTVGDALVDSDEDGLCDNWETWGLDANGDGTVDLDLPGPKLRANPLRKDAYIEFDWMRSGGGADRSHEPIQWGIDEVVKAFDRAPVPNPAGSDDGIALHIFKGDNLPHRSDLTMALLDRIKLRGVTFPCAVAYGFGDADDRASPNCVNRLAARRLVFRYAINGHNQAAPNNGSSGRGELLGNDFFLTVGDWSEAVIKINSGNRRRGFGAALALVEGATLMHEAGHTFNLRHGGTDDVNCKPNYPSVMNYSLQFGDVVPTRRLDYSRTQMSTLNEASLDETMGLDGPGDRWAVYSEGSVAGRMGRQRVVRANAAPIDWDGDGTNITVNQAAEINFYANWCSFGSGFDALVGHDDWGALRIDFRSSTDFDDGATRDESRFLVEMTEEQHREAAETSDFDGDEHFNAFDNCPAVANPGQEDTNGDEIGDACEGEDPDLRVSVIEAPDHVNELDTLRYVFEVENLGPVEAAGVGFTSEVDTSVAVLSIEPEDCVFGRVSIDCTFDLLAVGEARTVSVAFDPSMPAEISGRAVVIHGGVDPNPDDNEVTFMTTVAVEVEAPADLPTEYHLGEAFPNPFSRRTTIPFIVRERARVTLELFDVMGRRVAILVDGPYPAGRHEHVISGASLPSGVYLYRIRMGAYERARKIVLIR